MQKHLMFHTYYDFQIKIEKGDGLKQLMTYTQAKKKFLELENYITLVENYDELASVTNWIIKNYALTNSISKVIRTSNQKNFPFDKVILNRELVKKTLLMKQDKDELHCILRNAYIKRYNK